MSKQRRLGLLIDIKLVFLVVWMSSLLFISQSSASKSSSSQESSESGGNSTRLTPQEILDALSHKPKPEKLSRKPAASSTVGPQQHLLSYPEIGSDNLTVAANETIDASSTTDLLEHQMFNGTTSFNESVPDTSLLIKGSSNCIFFSLLLPIIVFKTN